MRLQSSPVRVAVVGCGAVARRHHVPALMRNHQGQVAALCDPDLEATKLISQRFKLKVPVYRSIDEVLADRSIDVVDICTPGFTHFDYARRAMRNGKHVLIEKPPVYSVSQAEELLSISKQQQVKLGVVLNYRYRCIIDKLKNAKDAGIMGTITKIQLIHHANLVFSESPWLWDERKSKYLLYEFGIHFLDLMVYLCGEHEEILAVVPSCQESVSTTSDLQVVIRFKSGALGLMDLTQDSTRHSSYFTNVYVYGTGMDAFVRFFPPMVSFSAGVEMPYDYARREIASLASFVRLVITGQFLNYRNQSHQQTIDKYLSWITEGNKYPLTMEAVLPTIRLLNDLEQHIPGYAQLEAVTTAG